MTNDDRLAATATGQLGSFTKAQANAGGLSDRQLRSRVQSGFLEQTGTRTYRSPLTPRTAKADLVALILDIGDPCWVSGSTAAAIHGLDGFKLARPFNITTLRDRNVTRVGAKI